MDYEKAYKEAIERCKSWMRGEHPEYFTEAQKAGEFIFPELKESEDEKIIRTLKEIVNWGCAKNISVENNVELKDCLAWLEKQGEQKPIIIIPQFKVGDIIKPKPYNEEHLIKDINENGYVLDVDIIIPFKDEDAWEIIKQNHAWSKEDEKMLNEFIESLRYCNGNGYNKQIDWLKSLKDRVQPQPKQEWSEEDESHINYITMLLEDKKKEYTESGKKNIEKEINWLKSLKHRVQPQPKYQWTDEDEKNLRDLLVHGETKLGLRRWIAGLPEKMGSRSEYHWKPCENHTYRYRITLDA